MSLPPIEPLNSPNGKAKPMRAGEDSVTHGDIPTAPAASVDRKVTQERALCWKPCPGDEQLSCDRALYHLGDCSWALMQRDALLAALKRAVELLRLAGANVDEDEPILKAIAKAEAR
jgi:hypothetical protein